ncbi:hypothetical protein LV716_15745 [Flagellimonas sp. HMM57]|uniref:hypothetical protein n=1 Tax=unclassified Flagellimonas TaxID=2644544 RepID=UPI0013D358F7|nr:MULTISPECIES: hypothetical protein [unclassified Flagellimonas]UII75694.1 hypothetical protein LV716_15745 [Flagellimonas sp. HMM57]
MKSINIEFHMVKIKFSKKRMLVNIYFAISWIVLGIFIYKISNKMGYCFFMFIALSVIYLMFYFYQRRMQYLTIKNRTIKKNSLFAKSILLNEIVEIKRIGNTICILKTSDKILTIYTDFIEKDSLIKLNDILNAIEMKIKVISN